MSSISNTQDISNKHTPPSSYGPMRKKGPRAPKLTRDNFSQLCPIGTKVLLRRHVYIINSELREDGTVILLQSGKNQKKWLADIKLLKPQASKKIEKASVDKPAKDPNKANE